ncbi:hypothetical protein LOTGIDRAFT_139155, partial [Lottia gigantea]
EGPVNAIALNKDATLCVVAGRTVFRIVSVEEDGFAEKINLRVGKNINLNYCAADVAWNHHDESILASAATNGSVVLWNLNKPNRSKQECVLTDHKRTVNRVIFHKSDASILLSGSQDGTMKLFDIRKHAVTTTFSGKMSESVRDIQFCPNLGSGYFIFAAAYDNGNIQLWDMRMYDRCIKQFPAHTGPTFSIDWHPEERDWIATAGRDKMIKVWDTSSHPEKLVKSVQTIASVARIKWRPQRKFNIASASLLLDHNVNVWALGRPYVPFATFNGHKDVVSSIIWLEPHMLFTSGKDGFLMQHTFKDAKRPADDVIPAGMDVDIFGNISHAFGDRNGTSNPEGGKLSFFTSKTPEKKSDLFTEAHSYMFTHRNRHRDENIFIECAKEYKLCKMSFDSLCDHNAGIAKKFHIPQIEHSWKMLHVLFCKKHLDHNLSSLTADKQDLDKGKSPLGAKKENHSGSRTELNGIDSETNISGWSDEDSEGEYSEYENTLLANIASGLTNQQADFFFGDGEPDRKDYDTHTSSFDVLALKDYKLPYEAIQVRHELKTVSPEDLAAGHQTLINEQNNSTDNHISPSETEDDSLISIPWKLEVNNVSNISTVVNILKQFAEQGDVQSTVSMLIVLGDKIRQHIDSELQETWFLSYIELLGYYELWTVSAEVIKLCHLSSVNSLNSQSTTIHTYCSQCSRPLMKAGWLCEKCKTVTNKCSLCHQTVKLMYIWCQGCCHGGHIEHIQDWFMKNKECPTGCGHHCEYT